MSKQIDRFEFAFALARELPVISDYRSAKVAMALIGVARAAQRNAADICNVPDYTDRRDAIRKRVNAILADLGQGHGITYTIDEYPRGCAFRLKFASGRSNSFDGDGYCVPE